MSKIAESFGPVELITIMTLVAFGILMVLLSMARPAPESYVMCDNCYYGTLP